MQPESENTVDPDAIYDGYSADYKGKMKINKKKKTRKEIFAFFTCKHWHLPLPEFVIA